MNWCKNFNRSLHLYHGGQNKKLFDYEVLRALFLAVHCTTPFHFDGYYPLTFKFSCLEEFTGDCGIYPQYGNTFTWVYSTVVFALRDAVTCIRGRSLISKKQEENDTNSFRLSRYVLYVCLVTAMRRFSFSMIDYVFFRLDNLAYADGRCRRFCCSGDLIDLARDREALL